MSSKQSFRHKEGSGVRKKECLLELQLIEEYTEQQGSSGQKRESEAYIAVWGQCCLVMCLRGLYILLCTTRRKAISIPRQVCFSRVCAATERFMLMP